MYELLARKREEALADCSQGSGAATAAAPESDKAVTDDPASGTAYLSRT